MALQRDGQRSQPRLRARDRVRYDEQHETGCIEDDEAHERSVKHGELGPER